MMLLWASVSQPKLAGGISAIFWPDHTPGMQFNPFIFFVKKNNNMQNRRGAKGHFLTRSHTRAALTHMCKLLTAVVIQAAYGCGMISP